MSEARFDLALTLRSGQFFRFREVDGGFHVVDGAHAFVCRSSGGKLSIDGADRECARRFLGLDSDHAAALSVFRKDRHLAPLLERYGGMRVMRQDPWQCLVSFVCSAMSNVPRITKNVNDIARLHGEAIPGSREPAFPTPRALPPKSLESARLGWREKYVEALFARVNVKWLEGLAELPFDECRAELVELPGVGVKVAECVMAFGLGFGEACPVDVWIRRIGRKLFLGGRKTPDRKIAEAFRRRFGPHTALAQQILFTAGREGVI